MEDGVWRMAIGFIGSEAKQSFAAARAQAELGLEELSILQRLARFRRNRDGGISFAVRVRHRVSLSFAVDEVLPGR